MVYVVFGGLEISKQRACSKARATVAQPFEPSLFVLWSMFLVSQKYKGPIQGL